MIRDTARGDKNQLGGGAQFAELVVRNLRTAAESAAYMPLNCAALFYRNAIVPSFLSSVEQHSPNSDASRKRPSCKVISMPLFTASMT